MAKVLVLGAGFVAGPLIETLLKDPKNHLTVGSQFIAEAQRFAEKSNRVSAIEVNVADPAQLFERIVEHDVVVSLVPYQFHAGIAKVCIAARKHLVTASYENDDIKALSAEAKAAGITILNEIGLDPGIDHLSAMKVIDEVHEHDGKIIAFESWCGGLPAQRFNNNPLGYKFSWAPRSVLQALLNSATYLKDGEKKVLSSEQLLADPELIEVSETLTLEGYPNRDSLSYVGIYGLQGVKTMLRGTLRYQGFCAILQACKALGLLSIEPDPRLQLNAAPITWQAFTAEALANAEPLSETAKQGLQWLGVLGPEPMAKKVTAIDSFCELLQKKLAYHAGETDLVALQHRFVIQSSNGKLSRKTSTLVCEGTPGGYTAMAKTVGIPCGLAVQLLLDGGISQRGSLIPVSSVIYQPLLTQLADVGIVFEEQEYEI